MLSLAAPTLADCLAVLAPDGTCHRWVWLHVRYQITSAPAYAFRDEHGHALALAGFFPWTDAVEIWVALGPSAGPRLRELIGLARLTMAEQAQDARPLVTVVRTEAGARIARMLGFAPRTEQIYVREALR